MPPAPAPARLSASASYALLAIAWIIWTVLLTHQFWEDHPPTISRGARTGEVINWMASAAERSLPYDVAGLLVGTVAGTALRGVAQSSPRSRWVVAAAIVWLVVMATNCIGFVVHLFVLCMPFLYLLGILQDLLVAG
jgi:hypothetical protein